MASPEPSERSFAKLNHVVHERLPFSTVKISHSLSTVFEESVFNRLLDQRRVLAEFEANGGKSSRPANSATLESSSLEEMFYDKGYESVEVYLSFSGVHSQNDSVYRLVMRQVELVSIPDSVEEISESCFSECESLSRVTFGESSSLKLIGNQAFYRSGLREIHITDGVAELCDDFF